MNKQWDAHSVLQRLAEGLGIITPPICCTLSVAAVTLRNQQNDHAGGKERFQSWRNPW
jgi:hypothetical protein